MILPVQVECFILLKYREDSLFIQGGTQFTGGVIGILTIFRSAIKGGVIGILHEIVAAERVASKKSTFKTQILC